MLKQIRLECEGVTPLLMKPIPAPVLDAIRRGVQVQVKKDWTIEDEARSLVYRGSNNAIILPRPNIYACLVDSGTKIKYKGRSNISTKESTVFPMLCTIVDEYLVLGVFEGENFTPLTESDWVPDLRPGRNDKGQIVPIVRPKFPRWGFKLVLNIDTDEIDVSKVKELVRVAGRAYGLGSFRPSRKGDFGQFRIRRMFVKTLPSETRDIEVIDEDVLSLSES